MTKKVPIESEPSALSIRRQKMTEVAKELLKMPYGVMDDVFDVKLREYGDCLAYVGKKYEITDEEPLSDYFQQDCGDAYFVLVVNRYAEGEDCVIDSTCRLDCKEPDLLGSNYDTLEEQFRSDLGPLMGLFEPITPEQKEAPEGEAE